ncbi:hypothetical protein [Shewanella algae]|uniref:hypothetical protein n=1 Tax=Shewanella algae TaxID=38313 RepID=UPI000BB62C02|nr:hypothetical protein [Shewanella algae]PBQ28617.1 hypothetical protein AYI97_06170 [Shewanella algae]
MKSFIMKSLSVTVLVKIFGLVRDVLTFYFIGVSAEFDSYIFFLTIPAIFSSVLIPFINLWCVPLLRKSNNSERETYFLFFVLVSFFSAFILFFISLLPACLNGSFDAFAIALILTSLLVFVFSVLAEYSASLLIIDGKVDKIYYGNLLVNIPVVIYLVFSDVTVLMLAIVSSFSFVLRFLYLNHYTLGKRAIFSFQNLSSLGRVVDNLKKLDLHNVKKLFFGPSFQISIYLGRLFCSFLPEGSVSMYFYGFKLFDAFKGTVLFVVITKFFSMIQNLSLKQSINLMFKCINILVYISLGYLLFLFCLWGVGTYIDVTNYLEFDLSKVNDIFYFSMFTFFLFLQYPVMVLYQRLIVSFDNVELYFDSILYMLASQVTLLSLFYLLGILNVEMVISILSIGMLFPFVTILMRLRPKKISI